MKTLLVVCITLTFSISIVEAAGTCESLAEPKLANTTITESQAVEAGSLTAQGLPPQLAKAFRDLPSICRVQGVIEPSTDSHIRI